MLARIEHKGSAQGWRQRITDAAHQREGQRLFYLLSIEPSMERKAAAHLTARGFKALVPEMLIVCKRGIRRKSTSIRRPIFPGYVFLLFSFDLDQDKRGRIDATPGVHKFLKMGENYAIIPHEAMQRIVDIEFELLKPKQVKGPASIFSAGETVRISDGPFSGLNAEIVKLDSDERITVLISLLGRAVPTQIEAIEVEKL